MENDLYNINIGVMILIFLGYLEINYFMTNIVNNPILFQNYLHVENNKLREEIEELKTLDENNTSKLSKKYDMDEKVLERLLHNPFWNSMFIKRISTFFIFFHLLGILFMLITITKGLQWINNTPMKNNFYIVLIGLPLLLLLIFIAPAI